MRNFNDMFRARTRESRLYFMFEITNVRCHIAYCSFDFLIGHFFGSLQLGTAFGVDLDISDRISVADDAD